PGIFEKTDGDFAIEFVVFHEKDASTANRREVNLERLRGANILGSAVLAAKGLRNRIEEHRGGNGLNENVLEGSLFRLTENFFATVGGDHNKMWMMLWIRQGVNALAGFNPVDLRHLPIHKCDVVRLARIEAATNQVNAFLAGRGFIN